MGSTVITNETLFGKIFLFFFRLGIRYISYWFLLVAIICFLVPIIMFTATTGIEFSFSFLQYFTFINPNFALDDGVVAFSDFVKVFLFISFFVMLLVQFVTLIFKKAFHISLELPFKKQLLIAFSLLTLLYLFTLIAALFTGTNYFDIISIVLLFYSLTLFSVLGYMCLSYASKYAGMTSQEYDRLHSAKKK